MKKIVFALLAVLTLAGVLSACQQMSTATTAPSVITEKPYIGFSAARTEKLNLDLYTREEETLFDTYVHQYGAYSSRVYYDTLPETDQKIYHILQYAMDHAYPGILIDSRVMAGMKYSVEDILTFFSLDSAVVEQNLSWEFGEFTVTYSNGDQSSQIKGTKLYIPDFALQKKEKKDQSILLAERILAQIPAGITDQEKARYIYTWLGENVDYFQDTQQDDYSDYLYDALHRGKTNCDGFSNAFSLLCAMAQIPCAEKIYVPGDGSAGHTWNVVKLDGRWYNVDATASREVTEQAQPETYLHFGLADRYLEYAWQYWQMLPACEENLFPLYCHIQSAEDAPALIKKGFGETQKQYLIVLVESGAFDQQTLEEIAGELGCGITTRHYILKDGSAMYCIYQ